MKSWHDRVVDKLQSMRAVAEADRMAFHHLYMYLDDAHSGRDGMAVERKDEGGSLAYKGRHVCGFAVKDGAYFVTVDGVSAGYENLESALDKMAELAAMVVEGFRSGLYEDQRLSVVQK